MMHLKHSQRVLWGNYPTERMMLTWLIFLASFFHTAGCIDAAPCANTAGSGVIIVEDGNPPPPPNDPEDGSIVIK